MSSPSNLYAEKIYAEHPQFLWALDDQADYISIISDAQRATSTWEIDNGTSQSTEELTSAPFPDSVINKITPSSVFGGTFSVTLVSPEIVSVADLNETLKTFAVGSYFYTLSPFVLNVEIGYRYYDGAQDEYIDVLKSYDASLTDRWYFVSETFSPEETDLPLRLVIKINYIGEETVSPSDCIMYINGITFGQWCEEFQSQSLGSESIDLPSTIGLDTCKVVEAKAYGLAENYGYYFVNQNALMAKNFGVPLVFGSKNVTKLYENPNKPSLIIPSGGMMSESGKYQKFSLEFWIRTRNSSQELKRIVGPIGSNDGIYINGPFIVLKINESYSSYYVGHWERPMLIHWRYSPEVSSLLLNGEEIISIQLDADSLYLPDSFSMDGKSKDWMGFYAHEEIQPIEIDCVALYNYLVPLLVAKRRFVYGQGVQYPENLNASYGGESVVFDYSFADYTKNYNYPDLGSWSQASLDNIIVEDNYLTVPSYDPPTIIIDSTIKTQRELLLSCAVSQNESDLFLNLRPDTSWDSINSYLYFDDLEASDLSMYGLYGVFKKNTSYTGEAQVLIRIEDSRNQNYFSIESVGNDVRYIFKYQTDEEQVLYEALSIPNDTVFSVGLEINKFKNHFGNNILSFFNNYSSLNMYVGGTKEFAKTFTGNIYKIGICSEKNINDIGTLFNEIGVPKDYENIFNLYSPYVEYDGGDADQNFWNYYIGQTQLNEDQYDETPEVLENFSFSPSSFVNFTLQNHKPSIGIVPKSYFGLFYLDVDIKGSWKDYIPLAYFAQFVTDEKGDSRLGLDFIQFNVNYPAPTKFKVSEVVDPDGWSYSELQSQYSFPLQRSYDSLDNYLYTGYQDYQDLAERSIKSYYYDTSDAILRTFITFEYLETGVNASDGFFVNQESVPKNGVISPGSDWINTKYEVVDNVVIYPPKDVAFDKLAIRVHFEFDVDGIHNKPIKVKTLQLASQAYNYNGGNSIGTRFGASVYPYVNTGYYYNYKYQNPITVYKGSSPYLYLTRYSGLEVRGDYDPLINRGVAIQVNPNKAENYEVMAMQSLIRFNYDFFPYGSTQIMQINAKSKTIKFYMVADHPSGKRAKIYAIDANTGMLYDGISYYINGSVVKEPVINVGEWTMLGIGFPTVLNFKSYTGNIMINGPIIFDSLSYYQTTSLQEIQQVEKRRWARVKFGLDGFLDWEYWTDFYVWKGVLVASSSSYYGVNPADLYKAYTGTNKIIIDDTRPLRFKDYKYTAFQDLVWQAQISDPV
jgi:hypothetical protein